MKDFFLFFFFSFFLYLLQFGFFPAAFPFYYIPNLLLFFAVFYTFFEEPNKNKAFYLALIAGFFNDIAGPFIGFYMTIFFLIVYLLKFILKYYVQFPIFRKI